MKNEMKLTRHAITMAMLMTQVGEGYRSDIALYLDCMFGTSESGMKEVRKWEQRGLLNERLVRKGEKNDGDSAYKVLVLSPAGKNYIVDHEICGYYKKTEKHIESNMKDFDTADMDYVRTRLLDNRIKLAFEAAGIPAFTINKPHICSLYEKLSGESFKKYDQKYKTIRSPELHKQCTESECKQMLANGLYYTIAEVRTLLETISQGSSDVTMMSRARGVFISKDECYIVYIPKRGKNRNIKIDRKSEQNLQTMLKTLLMFTKVKRVLPEMSIRELNLKTGEYSISKYVYNSVNALVISDTDNMVFQLGKRFEMKNNEPDKEQKETGNTWLVNNPDLYERVYVAPYSVAGIQSINYICTHSIEAWHHESLNELKIIPNVFVNDYNPNFPASTKEGTRITYMPVYEMNTLEKIKHDNSAYGILTYSDMVDAISKHVCKIIDYYDIENGEHINDNTPIGLYSQNGNLVGKNLILEELDLHELQTVAKEMNKLPELFGYSNDINFYNAIALGKDDAPTMVQIINTLETTDADRTRKPKKKQLSITFDEEFRENLRKASRLYNLSASRYIKLLIEERVKQDAKKYDEALAEDRAVRKGK